MKRYKVRYICRAIGRVVERDAELCAKQLAEIKQSPAFAVESIETMHELLERL